MTESLDQMVKKVIKGSAAKGLQRNFRPQPVQDLLRKRKPRQNHCPDVNISSSDTIKKKLVAIVNKFKEQGQLSSLKLKELRETSGALKTNYTQPRFKGKIKPPLRKNTEAQKLKPLPVWED